MIDLHCHILPGIDDGPESIEETVEMCRIAVADGIRTIVATPHFRPGKFEFQDVSGRIGTLRMELDRRGIDLTLLSGADITVTPELSMHLLQQPALTINGTGKYFLAELPHDAVPNKWDEFLLSFRKRGITPIITHPERNHWFLSHPDALYPYVLAGGLVQVTAMSILGENGSEAGEYCRHLLQLNQVHVIASDAHSRGDRPPKLADAVKAAGKLIGENRAMRLVRDIPQCIISGKQVEMLQAESERPKRRKWFHRILDL